ncbi:DUF881 domain-containing protein [Marmoricola sp. URHB0036]|uniref:DUF881 domain-containing protein n=1 Tax=Marmoricola sp. URHB0036 TaxID=1298863 RepID=UPI000404201A|nr:DUF881 domain-containing protein [Marmoricola sp. URHB0036]
MARDADTRLPPQAAMGLLDYLTTHAMDEDYEFVSERRQRAEARGESVEKAPSRSRIGVVGALVMALFAVLVVTAAVQTSRNSVSDEKERRELVGQVDQARAQVDGDRSRLTALQQEVRRLQTRQLSNDTSAKGVLDTIKLLGMRAGTIPVRGPGVRVVADDAKGADSARNEVLDSDLQKLVNGLWEAGAEAISLNGQRLTNLSTIRLAGNAITVNAHSLRRPYVVQAIGNKDTLPARFAETTSGQAWLDLQREVGLRLKITPESSLRLPAAEVSLRYANQKKPGGAS